MCGFLILDMCGFKMLDVCGFKISGGVRILYVAPTKMGERESERKDMFLTWLFVRLFRVFL